MNILKQIVWFHVNKWHMTGDLTGNLFDIKGDAAIGSIIGQIQKTKIIVRRK